VIRRPGESSRIAITARMKLRRSSFFSTARSAHNGIPDGWELGHASKSRLVSLERFRPSGIDSISSPPLQERARGRTDLSAEPPPQNKSAALGLSLSTDHQRQKSLKRSGDSYLPVTRLRLCRKHSAPARSSLRRPRARGPARPWSRPCRADRQSCASRCRLGLKSYAGRLIVSLYSVELMASILPRSCSGTFSDTVRRAERCRCDSVQK
jgi:hypothetical protein